MGLGYNTRAINLHKTAQKIVKEHDGDVIRALQDFKSLPGIGPYTAAAVQIFSQNRDITAVDTNIRRIFIHEFGLSDKTGDREVWALAKKCLPQGKSRDWHNALMDYGATLMTARRTGIRPKTRQSRFEGSNRQIRAKMLRHLLKSEACSFQELKRIAETDKDAKTDKERLQKILDKMLKEGVIKKKGAGYFV